MKLRSGGGAHDTGWLRRGRQEDRTQREEQQEHKVGNRTWSKCVTLSVNGGWWMPPGPPPGKPGVLTFVKFSQPRAACHKYSGAFIHSNSNPNFFFLRYSVHLCLGELGKIPQWCFLAKTLWLLKSEIFFFQLQFFPFPLWACEVRRSLLWQWDQTKRKLCSQPPPPTSWIQATDLSRVGPQHRPVTLFQAAQPCDQKTVDRQPSATAARSLHLLG